MNTESISHLLHRAGQRADETFAGKAGDLTARQAAVLAAIAALPEPSQTQLVGATGIDRSTMADIVRRLSRHGLIARKRTRRDARRYAVRLTEKGEEALAAAQEAAEAAEKDLTRLIPPSLRKGFREALRFVALAEARPKMVAAE